MKVDPLRRTRNLSHKWGAAGKLPDGAASALKTKKNGATAATRRPQPVHQSRWSRLDFGSKYHLPSIPSIPHQRPNSVGYFAPAEKQRAAAGGDACAEVLDIGREAMG
jgi:hypothetical protein